MIDAFVLHWAASKTTDAKLAIQSSKTKTKLSPLDPAHHESQDI
jgi:hypothetical protein